MLQDTSGALAFHDDREDALVIDDPDVSPRAEVVVHIHTEDDGLWHRLTPNHQRTGCGRQFNVLHAVLRREELVNAVSLCPRCFTDYERELAADADAKRHRDTLEQVPLRLHEWLDDPNRPNNPRRKK